MLGMVMSIGEAESHELSGILLNTGKKLGRYPLVDGHLLWAACVKDVITDALCDADLGITGWVKAWVEDEERLITAAA